VTARQRTERRRIVSADDIVKAIAWRVDGLDPQKVASIGERTLELQDLCSGDPAVEVLLRDISEAFPKDRREHWVLLCALAARGAVDTKRQDVFWGAGMVVVQALQKNPKSAAPRAVDQLTILLQGFLGRHPATTPTEAWHHCIDIAKLGGDDIIADYDLDKELLAYCPHRGTGHMEDISFVAFERRVGRIKEHQKTDISKADVRRAA